MNIPVTYDWTKFRSYAERCHIGSYQILETPDNEHKEIRVHAGRFGFMATFEKDNPTDLQQLTLIVQFCEFEGFIQVDETVSEEDFYD